MTSKISFSKFLKENIRHRAWLAVLSWIILLGQTVYVMLILEVSLSPDSFSDLAQQLDEIRKGFPGLLNGSFGFGRSTALFLMAILCAVTGFSYLHFADRTDFHHSLPLSRTKWFSISYVGGVLIFLVPYLVSSLLTVLAGVSFGIMTPSVLLKSCIAAMGGILAFLLIYHVAVLAMMLTGKMVTGVLATLALSVYGSMVGGLGLNMASDFFDTYSGQGYELYEMIFGFLSPYAMFSRLLAGTAGNEASFGAPYLLERFALVSDTGSLLPIVIFTVLFLAVLWALSLWLYKKRPSEAAGAALAYPQTAPLIKVLVAIPTALYLGMLIYPGYDGGTKWFVIISILAVILLCGLIEFIYHMDLRRLFAGKISSLVSILGVIGILCIFQFDLFGFDTWFPEERELESMSFEINELYNYFCYPYSMVHNVEQSASPDLLDGEEGTFYDFTPIYELAREGVENVNNGITPQNFYNLDKSDEYVNLTVRYNKKSGKPAYRNYVVKKETALAALDSFCQEESFRRTLFPVFHIDIDTVTSVRLTDIYQEPVRLHLSEKQQEALFDAYKKDVLNVDISTLQYESPIGELSVDIPETGDEAYYGYQITIPELYLYESYENSLALLEEYGYSLRREIDPDDVALMKYIDTVEPDTIDAYGLRQSTSSWYTTVESQERIVTDPEEIKELLSQIRYPANRLLGQKLGTSRSVEITLKENFEPYYFPLP